MASHWIVVMGQSEQIIDLPGPMVDDAEWLPRIVKAQTRSQNVSTTSSSEEATRSVREMKTLDYKQGNQ